LLFFSITFSLVLPPFTPGFFNFFYDPTPPFRWDMLQMFHPTQPTWWKKVLDRSRGRSMVSPFVLCCCFLSTLPCQGASFPSSPPSVLPLCGLHLTGAFWTLPHKIHVRVTFNLLVSASPFPNEPPSPSSFAVKSSLSSFFDSCYCFFVCRCGHFPHPTSLPYPLQDTKKDLLQFNFLIRVFIYSHVSLFLPFFVSFVPLFFFFPAIKRPHPGSSPSFFPPLSLSPPPFFFY